MKKKIILAAVAVTLGLVAIGCRFGIGEMTVKELEAKTLRAFAE